jgi:MFS family permease
MKQTETVRQEPEKTRPTSLIKPYYVLVLLTLVWALQFANIQIVNIVLEQIKSDFQVSDTAMGLITGIVVTLFGSLLSMPIARLADRKGRLAIISIGVAFWSIVTTLGGFAQNVLQLVLTRIGFGIGGSVSPAPGNSLVSDYFPKNKLPMALAIMSMAPCIGGLMAAWIGGIVGSSHWGWRGAFVAVAIPGFIVAALLYFTVKEPVRGIQDGKHADTRNYRIGETLRFFFENKTYFLVVIGFTFSGTADLAMATWFVPFMQRVHKTSLLEASTFGGTLNSIAGIIGVLLGGAVISYLGKKNDRWKIVGPGLTSLLAGPVLVIFLFAPLPWAYAGLFFAMILMTFRMGPILGLVQSIVKVRMRAFAAATLFMIGTIIGSAAGPLLIGALNDLLESAYGEFAIRYSLLCVSAFSMIGALFYIWAGRYVKADIERSLSE